MKQPVFKNKFKTALIVGLITALLYLVIYFIADAMGYGHYAIAIAGAVSIISSLASYWNSDKMVLKMSGAHKAEGEDLKILSDAMNRAVENAGIPNQDIY